jgi:hypothetical protein
MRITASGLVALALLGLTQLAFGQDIPLEVKGAGVKVVKIDKIVIVKEDRTVVSVLPFTVSVAKPNQKAIYSWLLPDGVRGIKRPNGQYEIVIAPKGDTVIQVEEIGPDLDKDGRFIGFVTKLGSVSFSVGDMPGPVPPPPPPPPPPEPDKLGFVALALAEGGKLPAAAKAKASALADNFASVGAKLAATAMTVEEANAELRAKNQATVGPDRDAWLPWFQAWKVRADGALSTKDQYVQAFIETAAGLRAVR